MDRKKLEEQIAQYPIFEYAFIEADKIPFRDKVRYICETECPQYGRSWCGSARNGAPGSTADFCSRPWRK